MHYCSFFHFSVRYEIVYKAVFSAPRCCAHTSGGVTRQWPPGMMSGTWQPIWGQGWGDISPFHLLNIWNTPLFFNEFPYASYLYQLTPRGWHQSCRRKGENGGRLSSITKVDFKESCPSSFSSRRVREGSHPPAPCNKGCAWCHYLHRQVKFQFTLLLGWPQKNYRRMFLLAEGYSSFFCIAAKYSLKLFGLRCSFTEHHQSAQHQAGTPPPRSREGLSSPVLTQGWGPGQTIASHLVSPAAEQAPEPHYLHIVLNRKLNLLYLLQ